MEGMSHRAETSNKSVERTAREEKKIEHLVDELHAAGYEFEYRDLPDEFVFTMDTSDTPDEQKNWIHITKVSKFFKDHDYTLEEVIRASVMFPQDQLIDALKKLSLEE